MKRKKKDAWRPQPGLGFSLLPTGHPGDSEVRGSPGLHQPDIWERPRAIGWMLPDKPLCFTSHTFTSFPFKDSLGPQWGLYYSVEGLKEYGSGKERTRVLGLWYGHYFFFLWTSFSYFKLTDGSSHFLPVYEHLQHTTSPSSWEVY